MAATPRTTEHKIQFAMNLSNSHAWVASPCAGHRGCHVKDGAMHHGAQPGGRTLTPREFYATRGGTTEMGATRHWGILGKVPGGSNSRKYLIGQVEIGVFKDLSIYRSVSLEDALLFFV